MLFFSDGWTATSAGGNPKISQPCPTSTFGSSSTSRRNARSASAFVLYMIECAPVIIRCPRQRQYSSRHSSHRLHPSHPLHLCTDPESTSHRPRAPLAPTQS